MKKVITYGTFDLLHYGHVNLLERAKKLGDYLIVVLSSDEFNWNEKHKKCYFSYDERKRLLESIRYVDLVIPETSWGQKVEDIKEFKVDTFVMGDDWKGNLITYLNIAKWYICQEHLKYQLLKLNMIYKGLNRR